MKSDQFVHIEMGKHEQRLIKQKIFVHNPCQGIMSLLLLDDFDVRIRKSKNKQSNEEQQKLKD